MKRLIRLSALVLLCSCTTTYKAPPADGSGLYSLPVAVSPQMVIIDVEKHRDPFETPSSFIYILGGERRTMTTNEDGDSDGFITYLGRQFRSEKKKRPGKPNDGPIIDKQVIQLATGEEIVIAGNTALGCGSRSVSSRLRPSSLLVRSSFVDDASRQLIKADRKITP